MSFEQTPGRTASATAGPPPGWYLDPDGLQVLRWWDGMQWGMHTQPLPVPSPDGDGQHRAPVGPEPVSPEGASANRMGAPAPWAWVVAAVPVIAVAIAALARTAVVSADSANCVTVGWLIADIIGIVAAWKDARALLRRGEITGTGYTWLSLLGGWPYLWARAVKRTGRTKADWWLFAGAAAVWVAAALISVPLGGGGAGSMTFNQAGAQSQIAAWIKTKSGYTVKVACPSDPSMTSGTKFTCIATATDSSTIPVEVTVQDNRGDIVWQAGGN